MPNSSTTPGTQVQIWDCDGATNQTWAQTAAGQLTVNGGQLCLDAFDNQTGPGTKVETWSCNGGANQQWRVNSNGTITGAQSGLCLDVTEPPAPTVPLSSCGPATAAPTSSGSSADLNPCEQEAP